MKVALINPVSSPPVTGYAPHLGLAYLAGALASSGHEVVPFDAGVNDPEKFFLRVIQGVGLAGVTATSFTIAEAVSLVKKLKALSPQLPVVVGGPHVSVVRERILEEHSCFDFAVLGEGEHTLQELASALEVRRPVSAIPGLIHRSEAGVVLNSTRPWIDSLDSLPFPRFDKSSMGRYDQYPLITSRGCPYDCIYCASAVVWGRTWRPRSPENIVDEIEWAIGEYSWQDKLFCITDDTFNLDLERSKRFCTLLRQRGLNIRYVIQGVRADRVDQELAFLLKSTGCQTVAIGIESANSQVLENIRKNITREDIAKGIRFLRNAGVTVLGQFMIGNPGDSRETVKESIRFAKRTKLDLSNFYLALPYPQTGLWDYVQNNGHLMFTDFTSFHHYSDRPIFETPDFTAAERREAFRSAQKYSNRRRLVHSAERNLGRLFRGELGFSSIAALLRKGWTQLTGSLRGRPSQW